MSARRLVRLLGAGSALALLAFVLTAVRVERAPGSVDEIGIAITIGGFAATMLALAVLCLVLWLVLRRRQRDGPADGRRRQR
jgi:hypothetical protein